MQAGTGPVLPTHHLGVRARAGRAAKRSQHGKVELIPKRPAGRRCEDVRTRRAAQKAHQRQHQSGTRHILQSPSCAVVSVNSTWLSLLLPLPDPPSHPATHTTDLCHRHLPGSI